MPGRAELEEGASPGDVMYTWNPGVSEASHSGASPYIIQSENSLFYVSLSVGLWSLVHVPYKPIPMLGWHYFIGYFAKSPQTNKSFGQSKELRVTEGWWLGSWGGRERRRYIEEMGKETQSMRHSWGPLSVCLTLLSSFPSFIFLINSYLRLWRHFLKNHYFWRAMLKH